MKKLCLLIALLLCLTTFAYSSALAAEGDSGAGNAPPGPVVPGNETDSESESTGDGALGENGGDAEDGPPVPPVPPDEEIIVNPVPAYDPESENTGEGELGDADTDEDTDDSDTGDAGGVIDDGGGNGGASPIVGDKLKSMWQRFLAWCEESALPWLKTVAFPWMHENRLWIGGGIALLILLKILSSIGKRRRRRRRERASHA